MPQARWFVGLLCFFFFFCLELAGVQLFMDSHATWGLQLANQPAHGNVPGKGTGRRRAACGGDKRSPPPSPAAAGRYSTACCPGRFSLSLD